MFSNFKNFIILHHDDPYGQKHFYVDQLDPPEFSCAVKIFRHIRTQKV